MMDKIPAALQHKIDYINALDIPVEQKAKRIDIATLDYKTYCSKEIGDYFQGTVFEGVASFLDKHNKAVASKWEKEQTHIEAWRDNFINDDKGLQPAKNPPPMPPVMPPKRDIKVNISGINPENVFTAESIAEAIKEIRSIDVHPSTLWPQIQTPSDTLKYVPYESPNDKPIGPDDEIIKAATITWRYLSALLLAAISGNLLGFAIFTILERSL
jgi:hypothetical protein